MTEILQTGDEGQLNRSETGSYSRAVRSMSELAVALGLNPEQASAAMQMRLKGLTETGIDLVAGQLDGINRVLTSPELARTDVSDEEIDDFMAAAEVEDDDRPDPVVGDQVELKALEQDSDESKESAISPSGLRLLQSIFGELESVAINSGDYEVITQLLYRLKYDGKVRRKDEVSKDEFKARLIGNFSGLTHNEVAESLGTTNTAIAQFFGSIAKTLKKDIGDNQSEARDQFVGTILKARNAEDVSDALEFKLSAVPRRSEVVPTKEASSAAPKLAKHALKLDIDLVDETYTYESRIVGSARAQVRHEAKKLGHDILVPQTEYDDLALIELMRVTIAQHYPDVDSYDLVSRYVNNRLVLTDKIESSVNASMNKWLAEALIPKSKSAATKASLEDESQVVVTEESKAAPVPAPIPIPSAPKPLSYTPPNYDRLETSRQPLTSAEAPANQWVDIDGEQSQADFRAEILENLQAQLDLTDEQRISLQSRATYDETNMAHLKLTGDTKEALRKLRVHSFGTVDWSEHGLTAGEVFDLFTSPLDPHNVDQINKKLHAKANPSVASKKVWKTLRIVASAE